MKHFFLPFSIEIFAQRKAPLHPRGADNNFRKSLMRPAVPSAADSAFGTIQILYILVNHNNRWKCAIEENGYSLGSTRKFDGVYSTFYVLFDPFFEKKNIYKSLSGSRKAVMNNFLVFELWTSAVENEMGLNHFINFSWWSNYQQCVSAIFCAYYNF